VSAQQPLPFDPIAEARRLWEARWGSEKGAEMFAVTSIMRAQQLMLTELNRILRPFDLTFARYEALMLLTFSRRGSVSLGKVGSRLQVHPTSVTNIVDRLEADGLVARVPHPGDRRATDASITDKGRAVGEEATRALQREFSLPGLSEEDMDDLMALIRKFRLALGDFVDAELQPA
jgi:DNA-binding MarR family transcriptional regulator